MMSYSSLSFIKLGNSKVIGWTNILGILCQLIVLQVLPLIPFVIHTWLQGHKVLFFTKEFNFKLFYIGPSDIVSLNVAKKVGSSAWGMPRGTDAFHASSDASLFSSSLPVLLHEKRKLLRCFY